MPLRGTLEADDLLKIVLVLAIVWILLEIVSLFVDLLLGLFPTIVGLVIVVLIVLWFFDRL